MIYKITNVEKDDFINLIMNDIRNDLKENKEDIYLTETVWSKSNTKGSDIESLFFLVEQGIQLFTPEVLAMVKEGTIQIIHNVISSVIYDLVKEKIKKYKNLKEYSSKKIVEIEMTDNENNSVKVKITLEELK